VIRAADHVGVEPIAIRRVNLGPVKVALATWREALAFTEAMVRDGGHHYFCFCEASLLSSLIRDPGLAEMLRSADAVFPDGVALVKLARIRGAALAGRVPGPSFLLAACEYGVERGWRHFFYGGAPGVADRLAAQLEADYPGLVVAGTLCPPFRPLTTEEELATKGAIEAAQPDLVWVSLGSPKQERWCAEHVGKIDVPLLLPVGAAFDFHSGRRPWAPAWVRKLGMEWVFRTFTGGRRTFFRNLRCVTTVGAYICRVGLQRLVGQTRRSP
jgi:N-acetylglucosaminyldiphosphoundecaprenol N-acetyl-beta-D-mannosaminyltransferase